MSTHYDVLGLPRGASAADIRKAFRDRAKQVHPDHGNAAAAPMIALNQAYEVLRDPERRRAYDETLSPGPGKRLPRRPAGPADTFDPHVFLVRVFHPADARVGATLDALDAAIEELAYDIYDDTYLARFEEVLTRADREVADVHRTLWNHPWPAQMGSARALYGQGLRLVEDALADFRAFTVSFDVDELAFARDILAQGAQQLAEVRRRIA